MSLVKTRYRNPLIFFGVALLLLIGMSIANDNDATSTFAFLSICLLLWIGYGLFNLVRKRWPFAQLRQRLSRNRRLILYPLGFFSILLIGVLSSDDSEFGQVLAPLSFILLMGHMVVTWGIAQWKFIRQLKMEKTKAELLHLKSQVNPHFFFNTLNNLYGLAREKSDDTAVLILKLSDMMRYSLYEGQKEKVLLEDELEYLKNFIELHRIRHHREVDIVFNHHIQESGYQVTPLLFIIPLENAFKHGVDSLTEGAYIHISLIAGSGRVNFAIENNFDEPDVVKADGIGLKNLRRRLTLIYPDKHQLFFSREGGVCQVQLELELS